MRRFVLPVAALSFVGACASGSPANLDTHDPLDDIREEAAACSPASVPACTFEQDAVDCSIAFFLNHLEIPGDSARAQCLAVCAGAASRVGEFGLNGTRCDHQCNACIGVTGMTCEACCLLSDEPPAGDPCGGIRPDVPDSGPSEVEEVAPDPGTDGNDDADAVPCDGRPREGCPCDEGASPCCLRIAEGLICDTRNVQGVPTRTWERFYDCGCDDSPQCDAWPIYGLCGT